MSDQRLGSDFDRLEREADSMLAALSGKLAVTGPKKSKIDNLKARIAAEVQRNRRRRLLYKTVRPWVGVAAAFALLLMLALPAGSRRSATLLGDPRPPE